MTGTSLDQVVDLGSGAGGTMPDVVAALREQPETASVGLGMTDLYPNLGAIERFKERERDGLSLTRQTRSMRPRSQRHRRASRR